MKDTGIVRKIDELGRVVLPVELRHKLGIRYNDRMAVSVKKNCILLEKQGEPQCSVCQGREDLMAFGFGHICRKCLSKLKNI